MFCTENQKTVRLQTVWIECGGGKENCPNEIQLTLDIHVVDTDIVDFPDIVDILLPTNFLLHNIVRYSEFLVVDITRYSGQR